MGDAGRIFAPRRGAVKAAPQATCDQFQIFYSGSLGFFRQLFQLLGRHKDAARCVALIPPVLVTTFDCPVSRAALSVELSGRCAAKPQPYIAAPAITACTDALHR